MGAVVVNGNEAHGHTDILGNQIIGIISSSCKMSSEGHIISKNGDIVNFPSHPHGLDGYGSPTNYRTHAVPVTASGKLKVSGSLSALDGDLVPVADEAGPNAFMQATQFKLYST